MDKKIIGIIILIIIVFCGVLTAFSDVYTQNNDDEINIPKIDTSQLEVTNNYISNDSTNAEKKWFSTDKSDINSILIENNTTNNIKNCAVNKSGDSSENGDNADFYGTNAAILVKNASSANLENIDIFTNATGANAIFVTNSEANSKTSDSISSSSMNMPQKGTKPPEEGSPNGISEQPSSLPDTNSGEKPEENSNNHDNSEINSNEEYSEGGANVTVKNVLINTYKDKSRGLDATYGGIINAENVIINTRGGSCAALATDRGEGTVTANHCELNTGVENGSGRGSPCIYSTGNITVSDSKGTAHNSQIGCIEGKNSITLNDCEFSCFAGGNREENGNFIDLGGFFIYQSMSGDADVGTATLNASNCQFGINESSTYYNSAPMFHVTNTKAIINLEDCECIFGSGILLNVSGQNQWGTLGSNGGNLEFNTISESFNGDIHVDEISTLSLNMKKSNLNGTVNPEENYGNTSIILDKDSSWTLTGDSHVSSLENQGTINYGSFTLYVNDVAYTASNPYK